MGLWDRLTRRFRSTSPEEHAPPGQDAYSHRRRVPVRNAWGETEEEERRLLGKDAPPRRVTKIRASVVDLIGEMGKDAYPNEFGASLRAEGDTITEIILVPGALGGNRHAILPLFHLPVDMSIVGTVHSHPSPHPVPSDADLQLFRQFGHTHIIIAAPYDRRSWVAYDHRGEVVRLTVVD